VEEPERNEGQPRDDAWSRPTELDSAEPAQEREAIYAFDGWGMVPLEFNPA
jgi:hypothetical protein